MKLPSWITLRAAAESQARDELDDFWYAPLGIDSSAGITVNRDRSLQLSVALACVRLISGTAGSLPLGMFEKLPGEKPSKRPVEEHPLHELLHDQPNEEQTALEFREEMTDYALTRGIAIAEIVPGRGGPVGQLIPIHPDDGRIVRKENGTYQLEVQPHGEPMRTLLRSELFIIRGHGRRRDCPWAGYDPISMEANSLGAALAVQDYGAKFFRNDARPSMAISWDGHFRDDRSRENWRKGWRRAFGQFGRRHDVAVLEHGMKLSPVSITNEQAQFLETRKYLDIDVCRIFGLTQPHLVGILDRATYSNIEQQSIEFVTHTMRVWLVRWEQAIRRDLIVNPGRFFAQHNVAGLLRGDTAARYQAYATGRQWGWLSVNDVRRFENMNPVEGGDIYLQPVNMVEAGASPILTSSGGSG